MATSLKKYNPYLLARMRAHFENHNPARLLQDLKQLSNQEFRTAGFLLSTQLLVSFPQEYWNFFKVLVPTNSKAYLGTFLKAGTVLYAREQITLNLKILEDFAKKATEIDAKKILTAYFPLLKTPKEVHEMLRYFTDGTPETTTLTLLGYSSLPCCYEFFKACRQLEGQIDLLRKYCIFLMKKDEEVLYNLVRLLQSYFDLGALPGTFSLNVKQYQLSRMDDSYPAFCKMVCKHR